MKMTVLQVFEAAPLIAAIIREQRRLPLKGAYRLARMHAKLAPEYALAAEKHDALIVAYNHFEMVPPPKSKEDPLGQGPFVQSELNSVPADKMGEFRAKWKEIAEEVIDIDIEPISLALLDLGDAVPCSIQASELVMLGELVTE